MPEGDTYTHGSFCWHEIASSDASKAKPFYSSLFGYQMEDTPMPGGEGIYTMVRLPAGDVAGLYELAGPMFEGVPPHWMPYVWVDDVSETVAKAKTLGGELMGEEMDVPGIGQMATLRDPTGAVISVYHPKGHSGSAPLGFAPGAVGWNELMTSDTEAARSFYTGLFGWDVEEQAMADFTYTTFKQDGQNIAGMLPIQGGMPPYWMPYLNVENTDATAQKAQSMGAEFLAAPQDVPQIGRFAAIKDPTGAVFSIMQWEQAVRD